MREQAHWQPVAPAHYLRAAENIVAGFLDGEELALWRSPDGTAQAWENRCPHRGTRLTLGRVLGERLSCAYHGWEFSADGGRCAAIPAHPLAPPPKNLAVKTFAVREASGMVWVSRGEAAASEEMALQPDQAQHFLRSLGIQADAMRVTEELRDLGLSCVTPPIWKGPLGDDNCTVFLNAGGPSLSFAHVWITQAPVPARVRRVNSVLAKLREGAERARVSSNPA